MKYKLLPLLALCYGAQVHTTPEEAIEAAIVAAKSPIGYPKRFIELQTVLAKDQKKFMALLDSLEGIPPAQAPIATAHYLLHTGQTDQTFYDKICETLTTTAQWILLIQHQVAAIAPDDLRSEIHAMHAMLIDPTKRKDALAKLTGILHSLKSGLNKASVALLNPLSHATGMRSLTEDEILSLTQSVQLGLLEAETDTKLNKRPLQTALGVLRSSQDIAEVAESLWQQHKGNLCALTTYGIIGAAATGILGAAILTGLERNHHPLTEFFFHTFPGCGTDICPGVYSQGPQGLRALLSVNATRPADTISFLHPVSNTTLQTITREASSYSYLSPASEGWPRYGLHVDAHQSKEYFRLVSSTIMTFILGNYSANATSLTPIARLSTRNASLAFPGGSSVWMEDNTTFLIVPIFGSWNRNSGFYVPACLNSSNSVPVCVSGVPKCINPKTAEIVSSTPSCVHAAPDNCSGCGNIVTACLGDDIVVCNTDADPTSGGVSPTGLVITTAEGDRGAADFAVLYKKI